MSQLTEEVVVEAFAARLRQIKVADGYAYDVADDSVFIEREVVDPNTDIGDGELIAATVLFLGADYPANGNTVQDFDQVAEIQLTLVVRQGFEQRIRPLQMLMALKRAAFTPVGGADALSQNLNSLIPGHSAIHRGVKGEAWTQVTFIVTARWCDDLKEQD